MGWNMRCSPLERDATGCAPAADPGCAPPVAQLFPGGFGAVTAGCAMPAAAPRCTGGCWRASLPEPAATGRCSPRASSHHSGRWLPASPRSRSGGWPMARGPTPTVNADRYLEAGPDVLVATAARAAEPEDPRLPRARAAPRAAHRGHRLGRDYQVMRRVRARQPVVDLAETVVDIGACTGRDDECGRRGRRSRSAGDLGSAGDLARPGRPRPPHRTTGTTAPSRPTGAAGSARADGAVAAVPGLRATSGRPSDRPLPSRPPSPGAGPRSPARPDAIPGCR